MNSIVTIIIHKKGSCWVFDDPAVGLTQEPFVCGMNEILEYWMKEDGVLERALADGIQVIASNREFPDARHEMRWSREECGGTWYHTSDRTPRGLNGWLCPALNKYFDPSPERLHVAFV